MKKNVGKLLIVALVLTLALALVACDPASGGNQGGGNQGGTVETLTYTVTFDTNGGDTSFDSYTVKNVPGGSYISAPKRADGTLAIPVKTGYTFKYWSYKSAEFGFADSEKPTPVEENITLTAYYEPNEYTLTLNPSDEEKPYDGALTIAGVEGQFSEAIDKTVKYDTTASNFALDVPKTDSDGDYFVYWYYYNDKDEATAFTVWASESSSTVQMLDKYTFTHGLQLYPMFHSLLPDYDVILDANGGAVTGESTVTVKQNDYLKTSAFGTPTRDGYRFAGWYYETTDDEGEVTEHDFTVYDDVDEDADNSTATKISSTLVTENETGNPSLTLKARWVKTVTISSVSDFETVRAALAGDDETLKAEYASAEYTLLADITLSGWVALFDETLPFSGVFDGNGRTVTIDSFAANESGAYGLFGFVGGTVKNLRVVAGGISLPDAVPANVVIGAIAAYAKDASIENCLAGLTLGAENNAVDFGGANVYIGAYVGASKNAVTLSCDGGIGAADGAYSSLSAYVLTTGNAYVGGFVGGTYDVLTDGGKIENGNVEVTLSVEARNAYVGGFVGNLQGFSVEKCEVRGSISANGTAAVYAGAFAGRTNFGKISRCTTDDGTTFVLKANGGSVFAGGVAGENKVTLDNCRVHAETTVTANGSSVYVGGVTGMERGSAVDSCYVTGTISVTLNDGAKYAYVGGAVGYSAAATDYSRVYNELDITVANNASASLKTGNFVAYYNASLTPAVEKVYYFEGNTVTVNGAILSDEEKTAFEKVEVLTEEKRTEVPEWAVGGDYLNLDTGYWEIAEGATHPALKSTITTDEGEGEGGETDGEDGSVTEG